MKLRQKNTERKFRFWNGSIIAALVASIAVFGGMLQMEKNMLSQYEKGIIWVAVKEIPKGQMITQENYRQYMEQKELDKSCIPTTALNSVEQIEDMVALARVEQGVLLTCGMFETLNHITENMKEPVIAGFKAEDMYQVVGGTLRAGDRVHIYNVEEDGQAMLVWKDVYVQQVFDASGAVISNDNLTGTAQRVNVYMDGLDVERFYSELTSGTLRVVKVCD